MTSWSTVGIAVPAALASDRPKWCTPPRTMVPPITMLNFKNIRLSMAQPSHVVTNDCIHALLHRAPRAGSVPHNSPDHFANDELLHSYPSYESPCWNNSCMLPVHLSRIREPNARAHLPPEAVATQERRLEAVRCSARLCENSLYSSL